MERLTLSVQERTERGKGAARAMRRNGMVPAVVYRDGKSQSLKIPHKELLTFMKRTSGELAMVNLTFPGGDNKLAMLKDYQIDPVSSRLLHTDFFEVSLTEKIKATVSIKVMGEAIGVKRDGGILQRAVREVELESLPDAMPSHLEVDITELAMGHTLHVSDLQLEEGVKVFTNPAEVIVSVVAPAVEKVEEPEEGVEEEGAEGESEEPEVQKKGKKEDEEAAPEEGKKKEKS